MSKTPTIREQIQNLYIRVRAGYIADTKTLHITESEFIDDLESLISQSVIEELSNLGFDKELRDNPILYCGGDKPIPIDERLKELKTLANKGDKDA